MFELGQTLLKHPQQQMAGAEGQKVVALLLAMALRQGRIQLPPAALDALRPGQQLQRRMLVERLVLAHGEALLLAAGCPKLNLQVRNTNTQALAFYERLGYGTDEVLSLGKRLIADQ